MPEGHTLHRLARLHRKALAGRCVAADSPQGRFAAGAARVNGLVVDDVEAYGKLLFYRFGGLADLLHVHLGLIGTFRTYRGTAPTPTPGTRLRLRADGVTIHLAGPMACRLVPPDERERLIGALGPDPLQRGADPVAMGRVVRANLARRTIPIGAALLEQQVVAGLGNVYRAEVLFLAGIDPRRPAREVTDDEFDRLWAAVRTELRAGERAGRIVTVVPSDVGASSRHTVPTDERVYVYKRAGLPCRRCGTVIREGVLGGRRIAWCRRCQT
jgi:endonuclease VIII